MNTFTFNFMPQQLIKSRKLLTSITDPTEGPYSRNISLITTKSQPVCLQPIPGQNFPNLELSSFLAFKLSESSKNSILERISQDDEEKTISLSEHSSQITLKINSNSLSANLSSIEKVPELKFCSQSIKFSNKGNFFFLISKIPLCDHFSIQRFKADFESEFFFVVNSDKFYGEMVKIEMMRRGIEFCLSERGILFEERIGNGGEEGISVQVEIWVENRNFRYLARVKRSVGEDWRSRFGEILRGFNQDDCSGAYGIDENFFYTTSSYPSSLTSENMENYLFVQKIIEKLVIKYKYLDSLTRKNIERNQKGLGSHLTLHKILDSDDYLKEKQIIKMFESSKDTYFKTRFLFHLITFQEDSSVIYPKRPSSQPFLEFSQEQPLDSINSIFTLIEKLNQIGLHFKENIFPLHQFDFYEEKPIYKYDLPLSHTFDITISPTSQKNPKISDSTILKIKENFFNTLIKFSNDSIESSQINFTFEESWSLFENSETIELDEEFNEKLARQRIELFQSNRFKFFREYRGIMQVAGKSFLLCSVGFEADLKQRIVEKYEDFEGFYEFLKIFLQDFVEKVRKILTKNTNLTCFDTSCLGFDGEGKIMIEAKVREEVDESFIAPEVRNGRCHRLSLIYSLGKVLESVLGLVVGLKLNLDFESDARGKVFEEFQGFKEIFYGCTERFLTKRWSIEMVQEKVSELLGNFPKC